MESVSSSRQCVAPGTFEPGWLAFPLECGRLQPGVDEALPLYLHFPPAGPALPTEGSVVRLHGHFSDSRSTTCRITFPAESGELDVRVNNDAAEQWCRGKFVVDSYEVIG